MKIAIDEKQYDIALEKTTLAASLEQAGRQLNITLTWYNEGETMRLFREEGREEGVTETLLALAKDGLISVTVGASRSGMTEDDFRGLMERYAPPS